VDEDVDITNTGELLWAMSTRWDPRADSEILDVAASILNPRLSPEDKRRRELTTSCMVVDACRPYGWKDEFPKISGTSAEYKAEILAKWGGRL
jgi:3-polyprenyl-4-hydroxybenzoate decarboxylase